MKKILLILFLSSFTCFAFAQDSGSKEVTPQMLKKIKADVEKQIPAFKKKCARNSRFVPGNLRFDSEIEFRADTFRVKRVYEKVSNINYTTQGMAAATYMRADDYDKLLNKYYSKLLKLLKPEDKKNLIDAQRSWITYRNNEKKLISMMSRDEYSGGGTIQTNIAAERYAELVAKRAIAVGDYYVSAAGLD